MIFTLSDTLRSVKTGQRKYLPVTDETNWDTFTKLWQDSGRSVAFQQKADL